MVDAVGHEYGYDTVNGGFDLGLGAGHAGSGGSDRVVIIVRCEYGYTISREPVLECGADFGG
jgi:hypothetical protein